MSGNNASRAFVKSRSKTAEITRLEHDSSLHKDAEWIPFEFTELTTGKLGGTVLNQGRYKISGNVAYVQGYLSGSSGGVSGFYSLGLPAALTARCKSPQNGLLGVCHGQVTGSLSLANGVVYFNAGTPSSGLHFLMGNSTTVTSATAFNPVSGPSVLQLGLVIELNPLD